MKLNAHKFKIYNFKASTKFKFVNKKSSNISLAMLAYTICLKWDTKKVLNNPNHIWHELKKKIKSFSNQTSVVTQFFFLQISRFIFFLLHLPHHRSIRLWHEISSVIDAVLTFNHINARLLRQRRRRLLLLLSRRKLLPWYARAVLYLVVLWELFFRII